MTRENLLRHQLLTDFNQFARQMCLQPLRNEQVCNRSVLTKTDQLQTNLLSAESVFSLLQMLSLDTLHDVKTADEKQSTLTQEINNALF